VTPNPLTYALDAAGDGPAPRLLPLTVGLKKVAVGEGSQPSLA